MKYSLRSLMIVVLVLPPLLAGAWLILRNSIEPQVEELWEEELSLIHGTGQTIEPDVWEDELPKRSPSVATP